MMISQPAMICLNATWQRLMGRSAPELDPEATQVSRLPGPAEKIPVDSDAAAEASLVAAAVDGSERPPILAGERNPAVAPEVDGPVPLAANERRARAAALRAMALSRERRFDAARVAFAEAAGLDPVLDLTRTPAFWKLERAAHEAAIAAYLLAGRERDAAVLRARVQSTFRPKPLRPRQQVSFSP